MKNGLYRHYKGKEVELVGCYPLEDNNTHKVCVYKHDGKTYLRSLMADNCQGFTDSANDISRFHFVSKLDTPIQLFVETLRMNKTVFEQRCLDDIGYVRSGGGAMFKYILGDKVAFAKSIRLITEKTATRLLTWINRW